MVDFGRARGFGSHYSNAHNATLPSRWIVLFQAAMEAFILVIVFFAYFIVLVWDANGLLCSAMDTLVL